MAITNMLTRNLYLDSSRGGVLPELHLKEGSNSVVLRLLILSSNLMTTKPQYSVLCGIRPDGSDFFVVMYNTSYDRNVEVDVISSSVKKMTEIPGSWQCTLTLLDADTRPSRDTYQNCNFLTVLPFSVIVHKKA